MKKHLLIVLLGTTLSVVTAFANPCKVVRTDVFNYITEPSLPNGSSLGAATGAALVLKSDQTTIIPVGGSSMGYLFLSPDHKNSHLLKMDPSVMYDYSVHELGDHRIVIGSRVGDLYFLDHQGNLLSKFTVAPHEGVYVNLVEKDDSLLVTSFTTGTLYRISTQGIITKLLTQKELSETYTTMQEFSDRHIALSFMDPDADISLEFITPDGKVDFIVPNDNFFPNTFQSLSEISPGFVAISGNHYMPGYTHAEASIALVNLSNKQITYTDLGNGKLVFIKELNAGDYAMVFDNADGKEILQYFHHNQKVWEKSQTNLLDDGSFTFAQLSDSTLVLPHGEQIQFFSPTGTLKAEFDFKGLDTDPTSHQDQYPVSPIRVLADDTVMVTQWFFKGVRFSYLKMTCE